MKIYKEELTKLPFNLQLFAEGDKEEDTSAEDKEDNDNKGNEDTPGEEETKTFTQDDVNDIVSKRLQKEKVKFEKEFRQKLEEEKKEVERLSKLSAEEKEKELLEKSKKDLEDREKELKLKELKLDAIDILSEEKLPIKFVDLLIGEDSEKTLENINTFKSEWQKAIELAVTEKLKGKTPKDGSGDKETNGVGMRLAELRKNRQSDENENLYF